MSLNFNRTQTVLVNSTATMPTAGNTANPTNVTNGQVALIGVDNTVVAAGMTVSDHETVRFVQGTSTGLKWSMAIPGKQITKVSGRSFAPNQRKVVAIGYNRASVSMATSVAAGAVASLTLANSTDYEFSVVIKSDKQTFSERLGKRTLSVKSAAAETQLGLAIKIANAINNSPDLNRYLTAIIVGDGGTASGNATTSVNGVTYTIFEGTGASNYGVEVNGKVPTQGTGSYLQELVDFDIFLNDSTGFGSGATVTTLNLGKQGVGTYQQVYNAENFSFGVEGTINRTQFPINLPTAASSSTGVDSANITPTVTSTSGRDELVFSAAANGIFSAGDKVTVGGTTYEIKFFRTSTQAIVVTTVSTTAVVSGTVGTNAGANATKKLFYDVITLNFGNRTHNTGSATDNDNLQSVMLAIPAIDSGGAYNSIGTVGTAMLAVLNPYLNSLGFANISI